MSIFKNSLALFGSILLSSSGYGQTELITRTFDASCELVCNGSAEILNHRISPERTYYWRSVNDRGYRVLDNPFLTDLCPGRYLLRQVDISYEAIDNIDVPSLSDEDFQLISLLSFSSMEKRELTLYLDLSRDVPYLNYHTRAEYSLDKGATWKTSSQLNRKVVTDLQGIGTSHYLLNLPKSASYQDEVQVRIYARKLDPERDSEKEQIRIKSTHLESKVTTEVELRINAEEAINIKSTVSNEIDGNDGYISLDIRGGTPPYVIQWEDGSNEPRRRRLKAGTYSVNVSDRRKCAQKAEFTILPPSGQGSIQDFSLSKTLNIGLFRLEIIGLYRQPLDLVITGSEYDEVKRFKINPLYEDLIMELDLSFLEKGNYDATLSTEGFSKKSSISIE